MSPVTRAGEPEKRDRVTAIPFHFFNPHPAARSPIAHASAAKRTAIEAA
jgi:hypothetical protein